MNSVALGFVLCAAIALAALPRQWAALPFLVATCYVPLEVGVQLGSFNFYVLRLMIAVAILRALIRQEGLSTPPNGLDRLILLWATIALTSSIFYADAGAVLVNRLGLVYTGCGTYFVLRTLCPSFEDAIRLCRITAILLIPLAVIILYEKQTGSNLFSIFGGGVNETSSVRDGVVRAQGPFAHSILAGSVGGTCLPLVMALFQRNRALTISCLTLVFSSGSSGPILTLAFGIIGLLLWTWRDRVRLLRWIAVIGYVALDIVMKAPAYYLLARIDLTGSSTSWHRAALIEAAIDHLSEWWLAGTSYTRHWLPYGVEWSGNHIDITNYYLRMGVDGGLPLMAAFIAILAKAFSIVGKSVHGNDGARPTYAFQRWALGASLFAHSATFMSVSYFDQTVAFLYLTLALIGSSLTTDITSSGGAVMDNIDVSNIDNAIGRRLNAELR
jgi:hypothetical protein